MGARRLHSLGVRELEPLLGQCDSCATLLSGDSAWAGAAVDRFGLCGVVARDSGRPLGWLLLSPALNLPPSHPLAGSPARSSDAAQLLAVHGAPGDRSDGVGGQLVQHAAARLVDAVSAIDAVGGDTATSCLVPATDWLQQVGFQPIDGSASGGRIAATTPLRLDLSRSVRWRPMLDRALDAVTGWVRPGVAWPQPSGSRVADRRP